MTAKPSYEELERRVAALEKQVEQYQTTGLQYSPEILSVLMEAFRYIPLCKTFEDAAKHIFDHCKCLTGAHSGYVALLSENGEENEVLYLDAGGLPCDVDPNLPMPIRGLRGIAYKTKEVAYDNAFTESPWLEHMPEGHVKLENVLFTPLNIEDKTVGVIGLANKPGGFDKKDLHTSKLLGDLAAVALTYAVSQDALRESEALFRKMFKDHSAVMLLIAPNTGQIVKANQAAAQYYGYPLEKMHQMKIQQLNILSPEEVTEEMRSAFNKQLNIFEFRHLLADGQVRDVEVHSVPITIQHQTLLFSIIRDITERKRAEEVLAHQRKTYEQILDHSLAGYWDWDIPTGNEYLSPTFKKMFGYEDHEIENRAESWQNLIFAEDLPGVYEKFNQHVENKGKTPYYNEVRYHHKNGSTVWVICTGKVIEWDNDGKAKRMIGCHIDITERKQAAEAQRHSNELMQYIIAHTNSAVAVHDRDLHYMFVSERYLKDYGVQEQDIIGKHHYDVFPDLPEKWREVHRKALSGEVSSSERDPYKRADGTVEWTRWECRPWYEANGSIDGIIVYTEVITERVQAEDVLRESEQRHRILFEEALNPILLVDENGHYIDANEAALQFMECGREKLIGRSIWEFSPPGIRERQKREHFPFAERRTLETDYLIHGRIKTLLLNVAPLEAGGKTVLCGIGQDITERKQAEQALIRQQRSIKLSSRIANVFLTSSRDEVFADVLDVLLKALDSRFGYFGYIDEAGDLVCPSLTRDVWDQCQVAEKSIVFPRAVWGGLWGRSLKEKQTLVSNENLRIPEGHVALENALATPIVHHDNLIGQFVLANKAGGYDKDDLELLESAAMQTAPILFAIQEDVRQKTAREKLEEQLRQAQKMESIGTLAGGIAHDFNNILFPIVGYTEMLLEDVPDDSPYRRSINEIYTGSLRARDLVHQILAFARQETSELQLMKMQPIIKEALKLIRSTIPTSISINQNLQSDCGAVKADPTQIHQIVMNLATNAYHAMEENGGELKVSLKEIKLGEHDLILPDMTSGSYACLTISDTGTGMNKKTIDKIFEPFFTTKEKGKGTGMGLSVVHGIVKSMNGAIKVYSEPGKGTEFHIYLPIVKSAFETQETQANERIQGGTERILLVDDEEAIVTMEKLAMERLARILHKNLKKD